MSKKNAIGLKMPETFIDDPVTVILNKGAIILLAEALEAEHKDFLEQHTNLRDNHGRNRLTLNG